MSVAIQSSGSHSDEELKHLATLYKDCTCGKDSVCHKLVYNEVLPSEVAGSDDPFADGEKNEGTEMLHTRILKALDDLVELEKEKSNTLDKILEHAGASCPAMECHDQSSTFESDLDLISEAVKNSTSIMENALGACET